jgi:histidine triad (HIT) family protein
MPTIFTRIINREIPGHILAENDEFIAILDINPLVIGHTLVIPKIENDYIFDLEDEKLSRLIVFAKHVGAAIEKAVPCERLGVSVIGLEVPHTHVHLIPMNTMDDVNFARPKLHPSQEELVQTADAIRKFL